MSFRPKEYLEEIQKRTAEIRQVNPEGVAAFQQMQQTMLAAKHLDVKTKTFIAVGISVSIKCPYCVSYYVNEALKLNLKRNEIIDAAMVGVALVGGASLTYVTMVVKALDEFGAA